MPTNIDFNIAVSKHIDYYGYTRLAPILSKLEIKNQFIKNKLIVLPEFEQFNDIINKWLDVYLINRIGQLFKKKVTDKPLWISEYDNNLFRQVTLKNNEPIKKLKFWLLEQKEYYDDLDIQLKEIISNAEYIKLNHTVSFKGVDEIIDVIIPDKVIIIDSMDCEMLNVNRLSTYIMRTYIAHRNDKINEIILMNPRKGCIYRIDVLTFKWLELKNTIYR